ncbi:MAG TPA: cyclic nucleotide-binding domain-containing protein [Acidimicrobiales bacterium]|nr:cyclic nucleotide-binding domain-containing protein [Acidimicrobiales bacterium]
MGTLPLFSGHTAHQCARILKLGTMLRVVQGTVLTDQGGPGDEVFVVVSGTARCERNGRCIAVFGPGDWFGEIAVLDRGPRTATVVAESPMELMVFGRREFNAVLEESPRVARRMLPMLAARTRRGGHAEGTVGARPPRGALDRRVSGA